MSVLPTSKRHGMESASSRWFRDARQVGMVVYAQHCTNEGAGGNLCPRVRPGGRAKRRRSCSRPLVTTPAKTRLDETPQRRMYCLRVLCGP